MRPQPPNAGPREQLLRAHQLLVTRPTPFAADHAMQIVREFCERGSGDALLYHAALAARGYGRPQDMDEALRLVRAAAAHGDTRAKGQLAALSDRVDNALWFLPPALLQHCQAPRIFTVQGFLPLAVCAWLIKLARKRLERATVQDPNADGDLAVNDYRTNSCAPIAQLEADLVFQLVNLKIATATGVALEHQELTNILHYARNEEYKPHFDYIVEEDERQPVLAQQLRAMGQRAVTVLIYLNDGYEGGETEFPNLDWRFKGKPGDALIFWNLSEQGEREPLALHAGKPVIKGEKWLLSKWVRQRPVPLM
ncbi:MAG: 2OG-Fe(II) oxygenase [Vitreimonas sp.]